MPPPLKPPAKQYVKSSNMANSPSPSAAKPFAFESRGFTLAIAGGNNQSAFVNTAFANPLAVMVTAIDSSEPVNGGKVTFTC